MLTLRPQPIPIGTINLAEVERANEVQNKPISQRTEDDKALLGQHYYFTWETQAHHILGNAIERILQKSQQLLQNQPSMPVFAYKRALIAIILEEIFKLLELGINQYLIHDDIFPQLYLLLATEQFDAAFEIANSEKIKGKELLKLLIAIAISDKLTPAALNDACQTQAVATLKKFYCTAEKQTKTDINRGAWQTGFTRHQETLDDLTKFQQTLNELGTKQPIIDYLTTFFNQEYLRETNGHTSEQSKKNLFSRQQTQLFPVTRETGSIFTSGKNGAIALTSSHHIIAVQDTSTLDGKQYLDKGYPIGFLTSTYIIKTMPTVSPETLKTNPFANINIEIQPPTLKLYDPELVEIYHKTLRPLLLARLKSKQPLLTNDKMVLRFVVRAFLNKDGKLNDVTINDETAVADLFLLACYDFEKASAIIIAHMNKFIQEEGLKYLLALYARGDQSFKTKLKGKKILSPYLAAQDAINTALDNGNSTPLIDLIESQENTSITHVYNVIDTQPDETLLKLYQNKALQQYLKPGSRAMDVLIQAAVKEKTRTQRIRKLADPKKIPDYKAKYAVLSGCIEDSDPTQTKKRSQLTLSEREDLLLRRPDVLKTLEIKDALYLALLSREFAAIILSQFNLTNKKNKKQLSHEQKATILRQHPSLLGNYNKYSRINSQFLVIVLTNPNGTTNLGVWNKITPNSKLVGLLKQDSRFDTLKENLEKPTLDLKKLLQDPNTLNQGLAQVEMLPEKDIQQLLKDPTLRPILLADEKRRPYQLERQWNSEKLNAQWPLKKLIKIAPPKKIGETLGKNPDLFNTLYPKPPQGFWNKLKDWKNWLSGYRRYTLSAECIAAALLTTEDETELNPKIAEIVSDDPKLRQILRNVEQSILIKIFLRASMQLQWHMLHDSESKQKLLKTKNDEVFCKILEIELWDLQPPPFEVLLQKLHRIVTSPRPGITKKQHAMVLYLNYIIENHINGEKPLTAAEQNALIAFCNKRLALNLLGNDFKDCLLQHANPSLLLWLFENCPQSDPPLFTATELLNACKKNLTTLTNTELTKLLAIEPNFFEKLTKNQRMNFCEDFNQIIAVLKNNPEFYYKLDLATRINLWKMAATDAKQKEELFAIFATDKEDCLFTLLLDLMLSQNKYEKFPKEVATELSRRFSFVNNIKNPQSKLLLFKSRFQIKEDGTLHFSNAPLIASLLCRGQWANRLLALNPTAWVKTYIAANATDRNIMCQQVDLIKVIRLLRQQELDDQLAQLYCADEIFAKLIEQDEKYLDHMLSSSSAIQHLVDVFGNLPQPQQQALLNADLLLRLVLAVSSKPPSLPPHYAANIINLLKTDKNGVLGVAKQLQDLFKKFHYFRIRVLELPELALAFFSQITDEEFLEKIFQQNPDYMAGIIHQIIKGNDPGPLLENHYLWQLLLKHAWNFNLIELYLKLPAVRIEMETSDEWQTIWKNASADELAQLLFANPNLQTEFKDEHIDRVLQADPKHLAILFSDEKIANEFKQNNNGKLKCCNSLLKLEFSKTEDNNIRMSEGQEIKINPTFIAIIKRLLSEATKPQFTEFVEKNKALDQWLDYAALYQKYENTTELSSSLHATFSSTPDETPKDRITPSSVPFTCKVN